MDHLCYFCIVFVMLSRLLIAALWSPTGKGLTICFSFIVLNCVVVTFPFDILGQVWYLIVSIPDLCPLSYFHTVRIVLHILDSKRNAYFAYLVQCLNLGLNTDLII